MKIRTASATPAIASFSSSSIPTTAMKLCFEPQSRLPAPAIEAVCGLFHGQETCRTEFTVTRDVTSGQILAT